MSFLRFASAASMTLVLAACSVADGPLAPVADASIGGAVNATASAASLRLRCEVRFGSGARSTISVDGNNLTPLNGMWSATVTSGANSSAAPTAKGIGDEVEFDFSSQRNDIAAGATAIARNFIVVNPSGPDVRANILDAAGNVVASASADCRTR